MANYSYRIGFLGVAMLVALRVMIGVHFLSAGLEKIDPTWSSASYLRMAKGPLADYYKSMAPLDHDWDLLIDEPLPPAEDYADERRYFDKKGSLVEKPQKKIDEAGHIPYPTDAYGPWATRVADDWHRTLKEVKSLPGMTDEQKEAAEAVFQQSYVRLAHYIQDTRGGIEEYQHELSRLNKMKESDEATSELEPPYIEDRITKKQADLAAMPRPWVAEVAAQENVFHDELVKVVSEEQRESATLVKRLSGIMNPTTQLDKIDTAVMLLTLIAGVCLIIGLFTRLAAVVAAGFLFSIMSTQPPWAEGVMDQVKLIFAYQSIEFIGLLLLAAAGAGTWAGLDGLLWRGRDEY